MLLPSIFLRIFDEHREIWRLLMKEKSDHRPILYLNLIWHQHQPLYVDPEADQLQAPWVRTHSTKDYYVMPMLVADYPDIHCTFNLTPVLLLQIEEYYVKRLKPFLDKKTGSVEKNALLRKIGVKADPWVDLALKDTFGFDSADRATLLDGPWSALAISDNLLARFPEYKLLKDKSERDPTALTNDELRAIKFLFLLSYFDPIFLDRKVQLVDGSYVDVGKFVRCADGGAYYLKKEITERDCVEIVIDMMKVMANVVRIHRKLMYRGKSQARRGASFSGQIELTTTPFYHPILPLILDSEIARVCQPTLPQPSRFTSLADAEAHIKLAVDYFRKLFGVSPHGMWPAEGGVSHEVLPLFSKHGVRWIATDEKILERSKPHGLSKYNPHVVCSARGSRDRIAIFFRDTELSDKIGFVYKNYSPLTAADDFIQTLLRHAPSEGEPDRVLTVILDGENAWEWYRDDPEGRTFLRMIYQRLTELSRMRRVVTATPTEYIEGNPKRGIPPHPLDRMPRIEWLWPGSWINSNFDTWIGTQEKNIAWDILRQTRAMLESLGLSPRVLSGKEPRKGTRKWYARRAWREILAAEGSDWFWWMGSEAAKEGQLPPMARLFFVHIESAYAFAREAGANVVTPDLESLTKSLKKTTAEIGTMKQSDSGYVTVRFQCDARAVNVSEAIYITGGHPSLADWVPNKIRMYDDGTHGDKMAGDGIWTIEVKLPAGTELRYKFTNSGQLGKWWPGDEIPGVNRTCRVYSTGSVVMEILDVFGKL